MLLDACLQQLLKVLQRLGVGGWSAPSYVRRSFQPEIESLLQAPCILFIDEFDGLGKQRSSSMGGDDESVHTINQLLTGGHWWLPR